MRNWKKNHGKWLNRKNEMMGIGLILCLLLIGITLIGPVFIHHETKLMDAANKLISPCAEYPLGTDNFGRCILCRIVEGAGLTLGTAAAVILFTMGIGTILGVISGYCGGIVDTVLMRTVDVFMAFPGTVFTIAILAVFGSGQQNVILALTIVSWPRYARVARGEVLMLKQSQYVEAASAIGDSRTAVILRYFIPSIVSKILVIGTQSFSSVVLQSSAMSFLGLGVTPPTPDWGYMISEGKEYIRSAWWLTFFPGMAVFLTAMAFNFLGDGIRDILDQRMKAANTYE